MNQNKQQSQTQKSQSERPEKESPISSTNAEKGETNSVQTLQKDIKFEDILEKEKLYVTLLQNHKDFENIKIPTFFKEKMAQVKSDFFKQNLTDIDLKLVSNIFSKRDEDIRKELKNIDFEIDFGSFDVQKRFYLKYILMKHPDFADEASKAENMEVKVPLTRSNFVFLTRNKLDSHLTKFRRVYDSYCRVKSFLNEKGVKKIDEIFDFEIFVIIEEELQEALFVDENFKSFEVKWRAADNNFEKQPADGKSAGLNSEDLTEAIISEDYFRTYLMSLFRPNVFSTIKTITGATDLQHEKVVVIIVKEHLEFFEYMLKYEKVKNLGTLASKSAPKDHYKPVKKVGGD